MMKGNDLLFYAVIAGTILVLGWVKLGPFIRKRFAGLEKEKESAGSVFRWALSSGEFYRRLLVTIGILLLTTVAGWCPLPGFKPWPTTGIGGSLLSLLSLYDIGIDKSFSIVALGLGPFYAACILVQIVFLLVKPWRPHLFNGGRHRLTLIRATVVVTLVLTLLQAVGIMVGLTQQGFLSPGWHYKVATVATLLGGTLFLLIMAYGISRYGIGHGFGLLFLLAFLEKATAVIRDNVGLGLSSFVLVSLALVAIAWVATHLKWTVTASPTTSEKDLLLVLRPTWLGTEPIQWAMVLILLPATLSQFIDSPVLRQTIMAVSSGWSWYLVQFVLTVLLCTFYLSLLFRPLDVLQKLRTHGFSPDGHSEDELKRMLNERKSKIVIVSALFLLLFGFTPELFATFFGWSFVLGHVLWRSGILVAVGVIADLVASLRFLKERQSVGNCIPVYTAADEIEATIKKDFLKANGIAALIEPLRFTWGMPIRTMVDEYRMHVPQKDAERTATLLQKIN